MKEVIGWLVVLVTVYGGCWLGWLLLSCDQEIRCAQ